MACVCDLILVLLFERAERGQGTILEDEYALRSPGPGPRTTHQCHIKLCVPRDGPDPTRYLILYTPQTRHHHLENARRSVSQSVCSSIERFCLALLIHSTSRAALTSTALHGTPAPFFAAWGHCAWGTGRMRPCRSPSTAVRKSSDLRTTCRRGGVRVGGRGWVGAGGGGGLRGLIRRAVL